MRVVKSWEGAYLAMSALLGEPLDAALVNLTEAGRAAAGFLATPQAPANRNERAKAVASAGTLVVQDIDQMRLK